MSSGTPNITGLGIVARDDPKRRTVTLGGEQTDPTFLASQQDAIIGRCNTPSTRLVRELRDAGRAVLFASFPEWMQTWDVTMPDGSTRRVFIDWQGRWQTDDRQRLGVAAFRRAAGL